MSWYGPRLEIQITHIPTGISAIRTAQHFRTMVEARESAMRYIRSRVYMLGHPPMHPDEIKIETIEDQPVGAKRD